MTDKRTIERLDITKACVVAAALVVLSIFVSATAGVVVSLFLIAFLWRMDAWVPLALALVTLAIGALMVLLDQGGTAIEIVNWTFYFFALGVSIIFVDYIRGEWKRQRGAD
ncbi:MAG: hypothetical protein ACYC99_14380 [Candidatus Geothermincolia bacterium]